MAPFCVYISCDVQAAPRSKMGFAVWWHCFWWFCWSERTSNKNDQDFFKNSENLLASVVVGKPFWIFFVASGEDQPQPRSADGEMPERSCGLCFYLPRYLNGDTNEISWNGIKMKFQWILAVSDFFIFKRDLLFETMWTWTPKLFAFSTLAIQHPRHHIL